MENDKDFHLGICLPAALSGGAYTAGVMDYLIDAMDEWEKRKLSGYSSEVPQHNVRISLIGGSSEIGLTALIDSLAIQREFNAVNEIPNHASLLDCIPSNPFYHTWVDFMEDIKAYPSFSILQEILKAKNLPGINFKKDFGSDFLETEVHKKVEKVLTTTSSKAYLALSNYSQFTYPSYFNKIISTNLLQEDFSGKTPILDQIDNTNFTYSKAEIRNRGWNQIAPLFLETILRYKLAFRVSQEIRNPERMKDINSSTRHLMDLLWLIHISGRSIAKSEFEQNANGNVDKLHSKVFEKVRKELTNKIGMAKNQSHENELNQRTKVIMINPYFGDSGPFNTSNSSEMGNSENGNFIISPIRYTYNSQGERKVEGNQAIACGSLDGLGAFVCKQFRVHDFFLGRANCEKFLRDHFTFSPEGRNSSSLSGYEYLTDQKRKEFRSKISGRLQVIPIFSNPKKAPYMPEFNEGLYWPKINIRELESYRNKIHLSVANLKDSFFEFDSTNKLIIWARRKVVINRVITEKIMESSRLSLERHNQLIY
ncbi:hypothetical protein FHS59_003451 [Algoriphagus iocasae]|uniref:PNPLA domain-containing protein n=1 Tax=Algoriphagus iocasae TaxID=1836499 RepID=A0A841MYU4_9BACT|nr:hypothetical protein [Algoriphagus iocasae]MBB6327808.1 hypothetical protein [Algoriphagus iocasae]